MATTNDITGDSIVTKAPSDAYSDGWDRIFGKKPELKKFTDVMCGPKKTTWSLTGGDPKCDHAFDPSTVPATSTRATLTCVLCGCRMRYSVSG